MITPVYSLHESGSSQVPKFIFSFFSNYTNDERAVTRNILTSQLATCFILDQKSHYRCVLPLLHQDTRQRSILIHFLSGQYKTRTADYGLRTTDWVENTDLGIKRGLSITDWV